MKLLTMFCTALVVSFAFVASAATPAQLYKKVGGNPSGYIFSSTATDFTFATPNENSSKQTIKFSDLNGEGLKLGIILTERNDILSEGRTAFSSGDYRAAAAAFRKVADQYSYLLNVPNNFASEAKFFELECYRKAGAYKSITTELQTPAGKSISSKLGEYYQQPIKMLKLWAVYGTGDIAKIEEEISIYQKPVVGSEQMLPTPSFVKMPPAELAQIAYIRAKVYEQKGENQNALRDYYRTFTLGQFDANLSKQAMASAMKLQAEDPRLTSSNEKVKSAAQRQMQSLAYNYTKRFAGASLPLDLQDYNKRPEITIVMPNVATPEPDAAAPAVEEKPAEVKPDPKKTPKPKGKKARAKKK